MKKYLLINSLLIVAHICFRVDHYLGKQVVQEILPFRTMNPNIDVMLNDQNIDRIEIIMKETVDIKGE